MAISNRYSSLARPVLIITEYPFLIHSMEKGIRNASKSLTAIQRSDQKLWPFRTIIQAWRDQTSSTQSVDSSSTPCQRTFGNSSYSLSAIQRSDQKLWSFRTVTQAWCDQTSSSTSIDSSSTPSKRAFGNSSKSLAAIQRSDQKL